MSDHKKVWAKIRKVKMLRVPFKKEYCGCGKRAFRTRGEAERYRRSELGKRGKRRIHVYECPGSHDYHITFNK